MKEKKPLTIHDFPIVYRWDDESGWYQSGVMWTDCERIMGKVMWKRFTKYMFGSTSGQDGAYPWDVSMFLKGKPNLD
ncbi:MAG: hypothetical protein HGA25_03085 [Clostridiales bacterium]|nr:hypothetical protein [Clostridiales bacterium]